MIERNGVAAELVPSSGDEGANGLREGGVSGRQAGGE